MKFKISIRRVRDKRVTTVLFKGEVRYECPVCNARVYDEDRYCHHCGQPFTEDQEVDEVVHMICKDITHK